MRSTTRSAASIRLLRWFFKELPNLLPALDEAVERDDAADESLIGAAFAALAQAFAYAGRAGIGLTHLEPLAGAGPGMCRLAIRFPRSQVPER